MTILYQSECGSAPALWLAIILWCLSAVLLILSTIAWIRDDDPMCLFGVAISVVAIIFGFVANTDTRYTEIKATINDTISWQEINEKYKLLSQEGDLYTFKLKEDSVHE